MAIRSFAAVAAVFAVVASYGADLGKYMLPDADIMAVSVADDSQMGPYSKEVQKSSIAKDSQKALDELFAGLKGEDAKAAEKISQYLDLLTNGVKRLESAMSARFTPGDKSESGGFEPKVDASIAIAGVKNMDKIFAKLAADLPEVLQLENGALVAKLPPEVKGKARAWLEGDVLRVTFNQTSKPGAAPSGKAFKSLLARLNGRPYGGLRVKDPVGIFKRFAPPEAVAGMAADENLAEVMKLRGVGFDCQERKDAPIMDVALLFAFDTPETAASASEKLIGFKQMGIMSINSAEADLGPAKGSMTTAKKILEGLKVTAKGNKVTVAAAIDAKDTIAQLEELQKLKDAAEAMGAAAEENAAEAEEELPVK